jgi:hypothetical protein
MVREKCGLLAGLRTVPCQLTASPHVCPGLPCQITKIPLTLQLHQTLRDTDCFASAAVRSEREVVGTIKTRENILEMVQRSPRLSTRRMASRSRVSRMKVWRTLREEDFYPYHDRTVQHLEPRDHAQRMDLCHWIQAHPGLLGVILFIDEASFTRDGVNNS